MVIFIDEDTLDYEEFVEGDLIPDDLKGEETVYEEERV